MDIEKAKKEFIKYTNNYDLQNDNITRKIGHSIRVMEISESIAKDLDLTKEQIELATLIGLLHDIARFEQMKRYASLGVRAVEINAGWLADEKAYTLLGYAEELGILAVLRGDSAASLKNIFARFPALRILATDLHPAHLPALTEGCDNLYISTSAPVWGYNYVIHEWSKKYPYRFTFGSLHPYWNAIHKLSSIKWELRDSDTSESEKLFCGNAIEALGIKEA